MRMSSSYLSLALQPFGVVDYLLNEIEKSGIQFDSIAFRGMSGALVAPIIAYKLKKYLTMCRKPNDDSHAGRNRIEGVVDIATYIIIDDFIRTGETMRIIIEMMNKANYSLTDGNLVKPPKCVGIFLYKDGYGCDSNFGGIPVFAP